MLSLLKYFYFFIIITLTVLYKAHSKQIHVIRGEQDVFTNPKCLRRNNQTSCSNCEGPDAICFNKNCSSCRCTGNNRTYVSTRGHCGQCVENEYLLYVTAYNSSFLVQEKDNNMCLYHYEVNEFRYTPVTKSCNYSTTSQRWIWNRNGQLINTDTLECLEEGYLIENYYFLWLKRCNLNEKKQLWRCEGQGSYFFSQQDSGRYMNHGNYYDYITSYSNISNVSQWTRFGTNQSICTQAVGCEKFIDGSALIILYKTKKREIVEDIGQKEIALDKKSNNCSILQEQTRYLHQDVWKSLSLKDNIFKIFTSEKRTFLKWNLDNTPEDWTGIVIKLQFHCKTEPRIWVQEKQEHCVLIKFKGTFVGFSRDSNIEVADPGFSVPTPRQTSRNSQSSKIIIIIVCIILVVLAIAVGIGMMFYKRKNRHQEQRAYQSETTNHDTQSRMLPEVTDNGNIYSPTTDIGILTHDVENTSEAIYEEPASPYQALMNNRRDSSAEHAYQELVKPSERNNTPDKPRDNTYELVVPANLP